MSTAIDTAKVMNRRSLHFENLEAALNDVEVLAKGKIRTLGNWSPGQLLTHLARVMNKSIDGFENRPPWFFRLLGRWVLKGKILKSGMSAGHRLPEAAAREFVPPPTTTLEEGLEAFRRAVRRLQTDTKRVPSPFFGPMANQEWTRLHCRHAELHLSFLVPEV